MDTVRPVRRISAWIPTLAGLGLVALAARAGALSLVLAVLPGAFLVAGGVRCLLAPDLRAPQQIATGAVFGMLLALPLGFAGGGALGLAALAAAAAAFLAAGWLGITLRPPIDEVPAPAPTLGYSARVALDDAMLSMMTLTMAPPSEDALREAARESEAAHALLGERGWLEDPRRFHPTPPELKTVESSPLRIRGLDCEHLRFESEYDPDPELPGRERWLGYRENRTSHAWVLRRREPGPWLVCVHGFGMGANPAQDFQAFRAKQLHEQAGLNVALVALPVHGPRSPGGFGGKQFMGVSPLDLVHAESQAVWDLRRLIGWIRKQDATQVGLFGISLGAYTSAVLCGVEDGLACVIAGVPPADLIATTEHMASSLDRRVAAAAGIDFERDRAVQRVVCPLALSPRLDRERRFIFAATGDQFVPVEQVRALWRHWERPDIRWCTGGHVSALLQREPRALVDEAVAACFEVASPGPA
jgi:pimeloyl-ACP methyl ester carboxylesterase